MPYPASQTASKPESSVISGSWLLFTVVTVLYWISMYTYVPILSPYLEDRGVPFSLAGVILGSYGFMQIVVRLPLGIWSDRLRVRKPFLALGFSAAVISCLLFLVPGGWGWTLAARAVSGVSASAWVAFTVLFASYYPKEHATRAMGTISFLTVTGELIGMASSGWLADSLGWNAVFLAGAAAGLLGLVLTAAVKEPSGGIEREPMRFQDIASVMKSPMLWKVSTLSIMAHSILFITMFGFTPSQALALGADKSDLTLLSMAFMIPHAVTAILTGSFFAPRFGPWKTARLGFLLSAVCTFSSVFVPNFGALAVTQAVNGFAQGLHIPLLLGLAIQGIEPSKRATAMGLYQSVYAVGMFCGPFVAGWLNESIGLAGGFYLGSLIGLAACGLAWYWGRKSSR